MGKISIERKKMDYMYHEKRPWGEFFDIERGENFKVKKIIVNPGQRLSLQMHHHRDEHWVIVFGKGFLTIGASEREIRENEHIYIPKETKHRISNNSNELLILIETQYGKYLEEDDIVRFSDDYNRI